MLLKANTLKIDEIRYELVEPNEFDLLIGQTEFTYFYFDPSYSEDQEETEEVSFYGTLL